MHSGCSDRLENQGVRAGHKGHGQLAREGHSPLEMTVGQSVRRPEDPCSPSPYSFEDLGGEDGKRVGGAVWKHLEIRPCDYKWTLTFKEV